MHGRRDGGSVRRRWPSGRGQDCAPWQRLLQGDDARKAEELQQRVDELQQAGKFEEALKGARRLTRLRVERQGKEHWQAMDTRFEVEAIGRALRSRKEDQEGYAASSC